MIRKAVPENILFQKVLSKSFIDRRDKTKQVLFFGLRKKEKIASNSDRKIQTQIGKDQNYEQGSEESKATQLVHNGHNDIVVHNKYKIQVALCIDRFPLNFVQEKFEKEFREFKDEWLLKTKNNLEICEEFLHMKYNLSSFNEKGKSSKTLKTNFTDEERDTTIYKPINNVDSEGDVVNMGKQKETRTRTRTGTERETETEREIERENEKETETEMEVMGGEVEEELEELLSLEGISRSLRKKEKEKTDDQVKEKEEVQEYTSESDYKNIKRKPNDFLYLVVKYRKCDKWMFPLMDYTKSYTIRQVLHHLCQQQLKCEPPFFIGYCPCTYEKRKFTKPIIPNEILGRKIFYYRAHYTNIEKNIEILNNEFISDFAWLTRSELPNFLSRRKFLVIRDALPLT